ncbi:probable carbohydrate esterase At4g34215 [Coffea arabica]|uniref:Probable carbohydrate esterase At4g34215 n=1 Tax=Coffea arabica TaxID=13443 RepID=A0A6P6UT72_COFAR|nr:probable carbohydrate esterase At4g34215 [Coffea arabica]
MSTKILENSTTLQSGSQRKHIFTLAGQSYMAGRGGVNNKTWDGFVPHECHPNPSILRFNSGLTWEEAREPIHFDIDSNKTCGIGPGMVFANKILRKNLAMATGEANNFIGLVPCAVGGTSLSEWSRGSKLYNAMITRARAAMEVDDDDDYGESVLEAVLWFQGERDTITREEAESYETRLERFIQDFRIDLQSSNLPFFQVLLTSAQGPYMDTVREAQAAIRLPNVIKIEAKGLPLEIDGLHLSSLAQVHLGEMLADAFLKWRTSQRPSNL